MSVAEDRATFRYRFLEGFLGYVSISFFLILLTLSIFAPAIAAVFLIVYSFLWLLRITLVYSYMIFSYKNFLRWGRIDIQSIIRDISKNPEVAKETLLKLRDAHKWNLHWDKKITTDLKQIDVIKGSKFEDPTKIWQMPVFAIYNEPVSVLERSLESIYESNYDVSRVVVFVSQEARAGDKFNKSVRDHIEKCSWSNTANISEGDLEVVYSDKHGEIEYTNPKFSNFELKKDKLNVIFTQHPDGLVGEIMGKASNEDWGGRQISLFVKSKGIDPQTVLVTSLDADSQLGRNYFALLSYRFCLDPNRLRSGFEPIPIYTNNYFECTLIPRLISTQTTLWQLSQNNLNRETVFFANYSVSLSVLQDVGFWEREYIAEDYLFFAKCVAHYKGDFHVKSFYGIFKGDTVVGEDYIQSLENQYKQLQRWTWGGVESFPYVFKKFFWTKKGKEMKFRTRFKIITDVFLNHFFWATTPIVFSLGMAMPHFFGGVSFAQSPISTNLSIFAQYFAWVSISFIMIYTFITFNFVAKKTIKKGKLTIREYGKLAAQAVISPLVYGLMGVPAIDSQLRGIRGKYLGYWVTPKK